MARNTSSRLVLLTALILMGAFAAPAYSACTLPDGPANTLVPEGYRFPTSGKWTVCEKGAWVAGDAVSDARPFTPNNTGVCLPLENQFTKKNGVISMNFVPEKSRRNFYGFEHECVASTWWRVPGGATVFNPNQKIPDEPRVAAPVTPPVAPPAAPEANPMASLDKLYDDVVEPAKPDAGIPAPAKPQPTAVKTDVPSFSASETVKPTAPAPKAVAPDISPPPFAAAPRRVTPTDNASRMQSDYKACIDNCRQGQSMRLRQAENQCKTDISKPGQGKWNSQVERDFRRCRLLAARKENNALRACILPCKKQAGKNVWTGP